MDRLQEVRDLRLRRRGRRLNAPLGGAPLAEVQQAYARALDLRELDHRVSFLAHITDHPLSPPPKNTDALKTRAATEALPVARYPLPVTRYPLPVSSTLFCSMQRASAKRQRAPLLLYDCLTNNGLRELSIFQQPTPACACSN